MNGTGLLSGKTAVVTGASYGIGRATALAFAQHGADVALLARSAEKLSETAELVRQRGRRALPIPCDVTDLSSIPAVMEQLLSQFPKVDIWVNNAGISQNIPLEQLEEADWDALMAVNLKAVFFWSKAIYSVMKAQGGGRLIHIASIGGQKGARNNGLHYVASKGGVIALSKGFALNGAPYQILSNVVCPGLIDTDMASQLGFDSAYIQQVPLQRLGSAEDVAGACVYLGSSLSNYVTGATLDVNGGLYLR